MCFALPESLGHLGIVFWYALTLKTFDKLNNLYETYFSTPGGTSRIRLTKVSYSEAGLYLAYESEIWEGIQHEFN